MLRNQGPLFATARPPFSGPDDVFEYIGRYTHRVAISNERIISLEEGKVIFGRRNRKGGTMDKTFFVCPRKLVCVIKEK